MQQKFNLQHQLAGVIIRISSVQRFGLDRLHSLAIDGESAYD